MPYNYSRTNHNPLLYEIELTVNDRKLLASHVGLLLLGKHSHVATILAAKHRNVSASTDQMINRAQRQLVVKTDVERWKRDGWLFQMMTWISLRVEQHGQKLMLQAPHTNPAQHGIDGLGLILTTANTVQNLIISEDKYTENPRTTLKNDVWPEFNLFETGEFDSHLVTQITVLLSNLSEAEIDRIIENDIYNISNRIYRAGITPKSSHSNAKKRKRLFKGYDKCVSGTNHNRRQALTFSQPDIRTWMDDFSAEIYAYLETQRP